MQRKYLPTFSELVDRFTIVLLKSIFIPQNKKQYEQELSDIKFDINEIIKEKYDLMIESIRNLFEFIKTKEKIYRKDIQDFID